MLSCLSLHPQPPATPPPLLSPKEALHLLNQSNASLSQSKQVHARLIRAGLGVDPAVLTSLVRLYSSHRRSHLAFSAFSLLLPLGPTTFAWNLLIRAHITGSSPLAALLLFRRMLLSGARPDKFTLTFVTNAMSTLSELNTGKAVHAYAVKARLYDDLHFQNTLVRFYFACGSAECGRKLFDKMRARSVVSWTALLSGLIGCGEMEEARLLFERMPVRNVVSWTVMIDGLARNGRPDEAFELFWRMAEENVRPNEFTLVALLIACTELGSLSLGRWVHEFARENGGLEGGVFVGTALIDMYSKCGSLEDAVMVFDEMPVRSLATWNSMITSLGVHGCGREAVMLFAEMEKEKVRPDEITLVGVLCACVREEMVDEGLKLFRYVSEKYGIKPRGEHYRCLVELLDCGDNEIIKDLIMELDDREKGMPLVP